jgi:hypothetical protein
VVSEGISISQIHIPMLIYLLITSYFCRLGAGENPAQRDEDISPCFYIALSERTPAQVKVTTILTCRRLCTLNV